MYRAYLGPGASFCRILGKRHFPLLLLPSPRSHHNKMLESDAPTKAVWKYTSRGFPPASDSMSCQNEAAQTWYPLFSQPLLLALPNLPS